MKKKFFFTGLVLVIIFLIGSLYVPEYREYPMISTESIDTIRLNEAGNRLLVRTDKHDYDFEIPANALNKALAPLSRTDAPWYARGTLTELQLNDDGSFSSRLRIAFVGYDPLLRRTYVTLPDDELARLSGFGFVPFVESRSETEDARPTNAAWTSDLTGRQHDRGSLGDFTGADISTICCGDDLPVVLTTKAAIESNKRWNARLWPFTAVKQGIEYSAFVIFLIGYSLFTGGSPLPRG